MTRTLSKAYGSAGARFGVIFSQEKNIKKLEQYRDMYEISGLTLKWVSILLQNKKQLKQYIKNVKETRRDLMFGLYNKGIFLIPSESNWIHVKESDLPELPDNIVFRKNCSIPQRGYDWIRLQVTDNIGDYDWILK